MNKNQKKIAKIMGIIISVILAVTLMVIHFAHKNENLIDWVRICMCEKIDENV